MRTFARGVECSGDAAVVVEEGVYKPVDVAIVFSEVISEDVHTHPTVG
jgi:hypothetical protein